MPAPTIAKPWPRPWTWALVGGVLLFGAQATLRWWGAALLRALVGEVPTAAEAPPAVWVLAAAWVCLSLAGGLVLGTLIGKGSLARERHQWAQEQAAQERQRALERQLWETAQQIREETLSDEARARRRQARAREAEIAREARRRLGLPEGEA